MSDYTATKKLGLFGVIVSAGFIPYSPYSHFSQETASGFSVQGNLDNTAKAYFPEQNTLPIRYCFESNAFNQTNVEYAPLNHNLIRFDFDYSCLTPGILSSDISEEQNSLQVNQLLEKLSGFFQSIMPVVSAYAPYTLPIGFFFKDVNKFGVRRAIFNTVQGNIEVPAILNFFDSQVETAMKFTKGLASNVITAAGSFIFKPAMDLFWNNEAYGVVEEGLELIREQANYYLPDGVAKAGVIFGLGLALSKVIDKYKKADVQARNEMVGQNLR